MKSLGSELFPTGYTVPFLRWIIRDWQTVNPGSLFHVVPLLKTPPAPFQFIEDIIPSRRFSQSAPKCIHRFVGGETLLL